MKIYREVGSLYLVNRKDNEGYERPVYEIEVDEIVECKDCRWGRKTSGNVECRVDLNAPPEYHGYDWFCPNGER